MTNPNDGAFVRFPGASTDSGLTKREYLICAIAAAAFEKFGDETPDPLQVAKVARAVVQFADAVVNAVNT